MAPRVNAEPNSTAASSATDKTMPSSTDTDRKLMANDVIAITVYQEEDLATKTGIDKNGMVSLPLLGQIKVSGLTTGEAREKIQKLYDKDYLVNPQVNLIVDHYAELRFSVLGQVQKPGNYEFPPNKSVSLLEALANAGGFTRIGNHSKVTVSRTDENGKQKVFGPFDVDKMGKDSSKKPFQIQPDDVITVPETVF